MGGVSVVPVWRRRQRRRREAREARPAVVSHSASRRAAWCSEPGGDRMLSRRGRGMDGGIHHRNMSIEGGEG